MYKANDDFKKQIKSKAMLDYSKDTLRSINLNEWYTVRYFMLFYMLGVSLNIKAIEI